MSLTRGKLRYPTAKPARLDTHEKVGNQPDSDWLLHHIVLPSSSKGDPPDRVDRRVLDSSDPMSYPIGQVRQESVASVSSKAS